MEQWQVDTLNKCAKDGNLPKGYPFNKEQISTLLSLNPAAFLFLEKAGFISRTAPGTDSFVTTERWDNLKAAGNAHNLLAVENKDKPAETPADASPKTTAEAPKATPAPQQPTPTAPTPEVKKEPAPQPKAATPPPATPKPVVKDTPPAPKAPYIAPPVKEGMDLFSIICLAAAAIGVVIITISMLKK